MAPVAWHHQRTSGIHLLAVGLDSSRGRPSALDDPEPASRECGRIGSRVRQRSHDPDHFAVLFTAMLCVEISIMLKQIKKGGE